MIGQAIYGSSAYAGGGRPITVATSTVTDLHIGVWLQLYEITTSDGNVTRVVDFGDLQAGVAAGQVTYDGDEYTSVHVMRTDIGESTDGSFPETTLTVLDYDHTVVGWVEDNSGLVGATVDLHIIAYDDIATPALATDHSFRVSRVVAEEGPARVSITLASPAIRDYRFPRVYLNRMRCHNEWVNRFTHDDHNHCCFPSDEFEDQTYQVFDITTAAATEKEHGWWQFNCDNATNLAYTGQAAGGGGTDKVLYVSGSNTNEQVLWDDATRNGVFIYKQISGDTDVDVSIKAYRTSGDESIIGIVVQPQADLTSWVFWGAQWTGAVTRHLYRETSSGTSTDSTYAGTEAAYRLTRSGTGWTASVRDEDRTTRTIDTSAWTEKHTDTLDLGSGDLNVGVVFALDTSDTLGTLTFALEAYYMRFFKGGTTTCDRSFTACTARKNTTQFNGFLGMPDGIVRW